MSVLLLRPYGLFASGSTVTLPDDTEASLIAQGLASAVVTDTVQVLQVLIVKNAAGTVLGVLDQVSGTVVPFAEAAAAITSGTINGAVIGGVEPAAGSFTTLGASGAFGCNGATKRTSAAAGAALAAFADGAHGLDSEAHMQALYDLVVAMRAALVANGIMSAP